MSCDKQPVPSVYSYLFLQGEKGRENHCRRRLRESVKKMKATKRAEQLLEEEGSSATLSDLHRQETENFRAIQEVKRSREQDAQEVKNLQEQVKNLNTKIDAIHSLLLKPEARV